MLHNDKDLFERVVLDTSEKYGKLKGRESYEIFYYCISGLGLPLDICRPAFFVQKNCADCPRQKALQKNECEACKMRSAVVARSSNLVKVRFLSRA